MASMNRSLISRVLLVVATAILIPAVWLTFTHEAYNNVANLLSIASSIVLLVACILQWPRKPE
jgi:hypothetical protein